VDLAVPESRLVDGVAPAGPIPSDAAGGLVAGDALSGAALMPSGRIRLAAAVESAMPPSACGLLEPQAALVEAAAKARTSERGRIMRRRVGNGWALRSGTGAQGHTLKNY
jgi:hypothetical protein